MEEGREYRNGGREREQEWRKGESTGMEERGNKRKEEGEKVNKKDTREKVK